MRDGKADLALVDDLGGGSHGIYGRACQNRDGKQYPEVHNPSPPCSHPASSLRAKRSNPGRPCTALDCHGPSALAMTIRVWRPQPEDRFDRVVDLIDRRNAIDMRTERKRTRLNYSQ